MPPAGAARAPLTNTWRPVRVHRARAGSGAVPTRRGGDQPRRRRACADPVQPSAPGRRRSPVVRRPSGCRRAGPEPGLAARIGHGSEMRGGGGSGEIWRNAWRSRRHPAIRAAPSSTRPCTSSTARDWQRTCWTQPLIGLGVENAARTLLTVAARSMLQDSPAAAPYGWTHCLTMPQAVLVAAGAGADPALAIAVAATYVLGFRSTQGRVRLDPAWEPNTGTAAARVWFADDEPAAVDHRPARDCCRHPPGRAPGQVHARLPRRGRRRAGRDPTLPGRRSAPAGVVGAASTSGRSPPGPDDWSDDGRGAQI